MGSNTSKQNAVDEISISAGRDDLAAPPLPNQYYSPNRNLSPGQSVVVDFIFAGAERTGKTTLKSEMQAAVAQIESSLPKYSAPLEFKFYELPCDSSLAAVALQQMSIHLPSAHLVYVFLLTDFSSPVSLEKLPSIFDSLAAVVDSAKSPDVKKWFTLMNKCDLPEEQKPLKLVDFADLLSSNQTLKASMHLKTSLLPPPKQHGLDTLTNIINEDITTIIWRYRQQSSGVIDDDLDAGDALLKLALRTQEISLSSVELMK